MTVEKKHVKQILSCLHIPPKSILNALELTFAAFKLTYIGTSRINQQAQSATAGSRHGYRQIHISLALCFFQSCLCITVYSTVCFTLCLCRGISLDALDRWNIAVMCSRSLLHGLLFPLPTFLEKYFWK